MPKTTGQKLKILYILDYLSENTDEDKYASMEDILRHLEGYGISAERKSVYSDMEALRDYGADIVYSPGKKGGYFLASRKFETAEIKLLIDAVQSSRFITEKKASVLTDKLASLAGKSKGRLVKRQIIEDKNRTDNETVFYSVDRVFDAIHEGKKISFRYFEYALSEGGIKKRYRREGKVYTVTPLCTVRSGDYYYLVAYEGDKLKHYRADKLSNLEVLDEKSDICKMPDMRQYLQSTFSMYGGERQFVTLECEEYLAGVIADRFGTDIPVRKTENGFAVTVSVQVSPQFYSWVFSFSGDVTVVSPASIKKEMEQILIKTLEKHEGEHNQ